MGKKAQKKVRKLPRQPKMPIIKKAEKAPPKLSFGIDTLKKIFESQLFRKTIPDSYNQTDPLIEQITTLEEKITDFELCEKFISDGTMLIAAGNFSIKQNNGITVKYEYDRDSILRKINEELGYLKDNASQSYIAYYLLCLEKKIAPKQFPKPGLDQLVDLQIDSTRRFLKEPSAEVELSSKLATSYIAARFNDIDISSLSNKKLQKLFALYRDELFQGKSSYDDNDIVVFANLLRVAFKKQNEKLCIEELERFIGHALTYRKNANFSFHINHIAISGIHLFTECKEYVEKIGEEITSEQAQLLQIINNNIQTLFEMAKTIPDATSEIKSIASELYKDHKNNHFVTSQLQKIADTNGFCELIQSNLISEEVMKALSVLKSLKNMEYVYKDESKKHPAREEDLEAIKNRISTILKPKLSEKDLEDLLKTTEKEPSAHSIKKPHFTPKSEEKPNNTKAEGFISVGAYDPTTQEVISKEKDVDKIKEQMKNQSFHTPAQSTKPKEQPKAPVTPTASAKPTPVTTPKKSVPARTPKTTTSIPAPQKNDINFPSLPKSAATFQVLKSDKQDSKKIEEQVSSSSDDKEPPVIELSRSDSFSSAKSSTSESAEFESADMSTLHKPKHIDSSAEKDITKKEAEKLQKSKLISATRGNEKRTSYIRSFIDYTDAFNEICRKAERNAQKEPEEAEDFSPEDFSPRELRRFNSYLYNLPSHKKLIASFIDEEINPKPTTISEILLKKYDAGIPLDEEEIKYKNWVERVSGGKAESQISKDISIKK